MYLILKNKPSGLYTVQTMLDLLKEMIQITREKKSEYRSTLYLSFEYQWITVLNYKKKKSIIEI